SPVTRREKRKEGDRRPRFAPRVERLEDRTLLAYQTAIAAGVATIVADAGDVSHLQLSFDGGTNRYTYADSSVTFNVVSDPSGAVVSGNGTTTLVLDATLVSEVSISLADLGNHVTVASTDAASVNLSLGGGDDTLTLSGSSNLNDVADGGGGINTLDYTGYGSAVTVDLST